MLNAIAIPIPSIYRCQQWRCNLLLQSITSTISRTSSIGFDTDTWVDT